MENPNFKKRQSVRIGKPAAEPSQGTLLLVDDEKTVLRVTGIVLERYGYRVLTALDGREGLDLFSGHAGEIRAVLLDMAMPNMNGEEVFHRMRRIRSDIPVILCSGFQNPDVKQRLLAAGLAGFLQKPYSPQELLDVLRAVLAGG